MIQKIKAVIYYRKARKAASIYNYDFEHNATFNTQMWSYCYPKDGDEIVINMQSGRKALYTVSVKQYNAPKDMFDYKFKFLGYTDDGDFYPPIVDRKPKYQRSSRGSFFGR